MQSPSIVLRDTRFLRVGAVVAPFLVAAVLSQARSLVEAPGAALVLVLVVVGAAATGDRPAGLLAAVSSAAWFDFFLTRPYLTFTIAGRDDVEVAVLLVLVGSAVTELALWGRRQQRARSEHAGLLDGVIATIHAFGPGTSRADLVERVAQQLVDVLDVDDVRFDEHAVEEGTALLGSDGRVVDGGRPRDVALLGLPVDDVVQVAVGPAARYLVTASTRVRRPTVRQRRVAAALAHEVGTVLALRSP